jgi:sugar diacid utilization regulator
MLTLPKPLPELDLATRVICDRVAERLEADAVDLAQTMTAAVFDEIPAFRGMTSDQQRSAVLSHSLEHVRAVVQAIRSWSLPGSDELEFVRARGGLRASQQVPLSALLQSYRIGHRTVWQRLVRLLSDLDDVLEAVLALTTLTLGYTEVISAALAEGYVDQQRAMLTQLDRARRDLLDSILEGGVDQRTPTASLASTFALVPGADFLVVVMRRAASAALEGGDSESRAAETLRRHLSLGVAQPFVVVRHGEVVSIAPISRARTAAITQLVRQARAELDGRGEAWAVGMSTVCSGLGEVARGYQEARQAFEAVAADGGVYALLEQRVLDYVVDHADGTAVRMIPVAARQILESNRLLTETLRAYARAEMSIRGAADTLDVHPNTIAYRLDKLSRLLGRDVARFSELAEVLTWLRLLHTKGL